MQSPVSAAAAMAFRNTDQKCLNPHLLAKTMLGGNSGLPGSARKHTLGRSQNHSLKAARCNWALPTDTAESSETHRLKRTLQYFLTDQDPSYKNRELETKFLQRPETRSELGICL